MPNFSQTPTNAEGTHVSQNFRIHTREGITLNRAVSNKVFIKPLEV